MTDIDLLPPNQRRQAYNALTGDEPSQRAVLELTVRLAEQGIEPIEIFKRAALAAQKMALLRGKLPRHQDAKRKGSSGREFGIAVAWWIAKLRGDRSPAKSVDAEFYSSGPKPHYAAINRARKRHGDLSDLSKRPDLAKERALYALAWPDNADSPNVRWAREWDLYRSVLETSWRSIQDELHPDVVELLENRLKNDGTDLRAGWQHPDVVELLKNRP